MDNPTPKPQQRLQQLVDFEMHYIDETALVIGKLGNRYNRFWAIYLVEPKSFKRIAHQTISTDDEPEVVAGKLMDLLEKGVEALPGSRFLALSQSAADEIHKITGLRIEMIEHSMQINYDFYLLREEVVPKFVPAQKPKKVMPDDTVLATDASRRVSGYCAYGWISIHPGTVTKPKMNARKSSTTSINRLETHAIIHALLSAPIQKTGTIHVLSDSTTALKKVSEILADISTSYPWWTQFSRSRYETLQELAPRIKLYWVKGHSGNPANEAVDTLVRGSTLATTDHGVDKLALEGLSRITERHKEELEHYTLDQLLAGAVPYCATMNEIDTIAA